MASGHIGSKRILEQLRLSKSCQAVKYKFRITCWRHFWKIKQRIMTLFRLGNDLHVALKAIISLLWSLLTVGQKGYSTDFILRHLFAKHGPCDESIQPLDSQAGSQKGFTWAEAFQLFLRSLAQRWDSRGKLGPAAATSCATLLQQHWSAAVTREHSSAAAAVHRWISRQQQGGGTSSKEQWNELEGKPTLGLFGKTWDQATTIPLIFWGFGIWKESVT